MSVAYQQNIEAMIDLVEREIAAMVAGDLGALEEILPEKEAMAALLEADGPGLLRALEESGDADTELKRAVLKLRELLNRDQRVLGQVSRTMRDVTAELFGDHDSRALRGIYNASGRTAAAVPTRPSKLDQSL